tara:strand:+ start:335 stop:1474 length:1140 start_codon:yes stop_codon:yes gene_type:complete
MIKLIEIYGIGFPNKGAELMMYSIVDELRRQYGDGIAICCQPWQSHIDGYRTMGHKNILQLGSLTFKGMDVSFLFNFLPLKLLKTFGIARPKDIDLVLDASGLRYSDSWGIVVAKKSLKKYKNLVKRGKKFILLPQAFGPFENQELAKIIQKIVGLSSLCFPRDNISYNNIIKICGESDKILQFPDFTNLATAESNFQTDYLQDAVMIIPNQRMLDKTESYVSNNYYNFLLNVGKYLLKKGENLVILNHEGEVDLNICKQLSLDLGGVEIFNHWNPLVIKTAIGKVKLLISSRFHGCVSGLSQGVPVIATSWNHKYEMLLEEYNLRENVISLRNPQIDFSLVDYALKGEKISIQQKESNKMKKKTELMWEYVFSIIDGQ